MCYSAKIKSDVSYLTKKFGAISIHSQIETYIERHQIDPKHAPKIQERIYPGYYAPVIYVGREASKQVSLMRYGLYPPPRILNPKGLTTYNARRDNITSSFWNEAFMKHHGFVVIESFYEWVNVQTLLKAGVVTLDQVKGVFTKQAEMRKLKILSAGKRFKPTPTELKNPLERQIIIEFIPDDEDREMLAPVIFSSGEMAEGKPDLGFAIVTDDPPFEVRHAGHDRCPIIFKRESIEPWLHPTRSTPQAMIKHLVEGRRQIKFKHSLDLSSLT